MKRICDYCVNFFFSGKGKDGSGFCREFGMRVWPDDECDSPARQFSCRSAVRQYKLSHRKHRKESK